MVFWKSYPLLNAIQSKFNSDVFKSQIFDRELGESPTGVEAIIINNNDDNNNNNKYVGEVSEFLRNNFGKPPKTPILDIPDDQLLNKKDHIIILRDIDREIVGCIRYHYLGIFTTNKNEEIYCVDCFCVNKKWRGKGVGDYLLTHLHIYVNQNNIPYSMFLKEGGNLSIINTPLYSSIYVYRELKDVCESVNVKSLTTNQAYSLMDIFRELKFELFIIRNIHSTNQIWKLYKKDTYKILVCFQDAYQRFEKDGKIKKIVWATAWIESSNVTDNIRKEASKELSDTMYPDFDYVWMNNEWTGKGSIWSNDGPFHWYTYQWSSGINIKKSYCILN